MGDIEPQYDSSWILGNDPEISYGRLIDIGGTAEVHEVSHIRKIPTD